MFLQTNRRTFLTRTALGAGSVLFLPELLASCNDHRIPDPGTPVLVGAEIDWNDDAKDAVAAGLGLIPEVGEILAALVDIFWPPTKVDVWEEVKGLVENIVNQKIDAFHYQQVKEDLQGLNNVVACYLQELSNGNPSSIEQQWISTRTTFVNALPHFQSPGSEVPLLGLFAQFANMHLALLRDAVVNGKSWGRSDADQQQDVANLKEAISDYYNYTLTTYTNHLTTLEKNTPRNDGYNEPFFTTNKYIRDITATVLDFMNTWAYYDVTKYPNGTKVPLPREIYTDPKGFVLKSGPITLPKRPPTQGPTHITVWAYDRIDAVQLTYPAGSGPDGVTQTPRMGDQPDGKGGGGTSAPPYGGSFDILPDNPIVGVRTFAVDYLFGMQFRFLDGTTTHIIGGHQEHPDRQDPPGLDSNWVYYPHSFLSSVHINGIGSAGSADCVVYGFRYINGGPPVTQNAIHRIYITSPKERSVADFAQAFPALGISQAPITNELKLARQTYWAAIKARATC